MSSGFCINPISFDAQNKMNCFQSLKGDYEIEYAQANDLIYVADLSYSSRVDLTTTSCEAPFTSDAKSGR